MMDFLTMLGAIVIIAGRFSPLRHITDARPGGMLAGFVAVCFALKGMYSISIVEHATAFNLDVILAAVQSLFCVVAIGLLCHWAYGTRGVTPPPKSNR
jgi:hypothetical protein